MLQVRPAAVAGMFYPADPRQLASTVAGLLDEAAKRAAAGGTPKALIVPHAGYVYSGAIAASAYARLGAAAERIRRVVLLGPCHRVAVSGLAATAADAFETPLGSVPVDRAAIASLSDLPQVQVVEATHRDEHSLEVHLPFLQRLLHDFAVVPLVVGDARPEAVAEVLDRLWGGDETLIVVSSDLSHYLDYDRARRVDAATCRAIEALDPSAIGHDQACGRIPVAGLLIVARRRGLGVTTLDVRNSGDTAGDRRRVVGYGAWMFTEPEPAVRPGEGQDTTAAADGGGFVAATQRLLDRHGATLLHLAAASISHGLTHGRAIAPDVRDFAAELREPGASFVTLKRSGRLRGCVGSPAAHRPLVADVAANAFAAAFSDARFAGLKEAERTDLELSVSVLSRPQSLTFMDEAGLLGQLVPGTDGLIITCGGKRALFLPQVWETLRVPAAFLGQLKLKAGLPADHWSGDFKAWRFAALSVSSTSLTEPSTLWA